MSMNPIRLTGSGVGAAAADIDAGLLEDLLSHLDMSGEMYHGGHGGGGRHAGSFHRPDGGGGGGVG
jgi:hypothetical protein